MAASTSKSKVFLSRLFSTLVLWVVVTTVFKSDSRWAYGGLAGGLAVIAYNELLRMFGGWVPSVVRLWWYVVGFAYTVGVLCIYSTGYSMPDGLELGVLSIAALGGFLIAMRKAPDPQKTLPEVMFPLSAFVIIPMLFFGSAARLIFETPGTGNIPGAWYLLFAIAVTKFSDMGAYLVGSAIGKHKMIPHISPAKTWQGFGGALLFSVGVGAIMFATLGKKLSLLESWPHVIILSVLLTLVAVIGDLVESVIKRCLSAKDSGKFLPGIGGGFDLIDSLCFTFPVMWAYMKLFLID